jgi:hypothetical protein
MEQAFNQALNIGLVSMEPTHILGSFDVEKIMIFDASSNLIPPALPLPSIPSVSDFDE